MLSLKLLFIWSMYFSKLTCFVCVLHIFLCPQCLHWTYFILRGGGGVEENFTLSQVVRSGSQVLFSLSVQSMFIIFNTPSTKVVDTNTSAKCQIFTFLQDMMRSGLLRSWHFISSHWFIFNVNDVFLRIRKTPQLYNIIYIIVYTMTDETVYETCIIF